MALTPFQHRERIGIIVILGLSILVLAVGFIGPIGCVENDTDDEKAFQELLRNVEPQVNPDTAISQPHRHKSKGVKHKGKKKKKNKTKKKSSPLRTPTRDPLRPI